MIKKYCAFCSLDDEYVFAADDVEHNKLMLS